MRRQACFRALLGALAVACLPTFAAADPNGDPGQAGAGQGLRFQAPEETRTGTTTSAYGAPGAATSAATLADTATSTSTPASEGGGAAASAGTQLDPDEVAALETAAEAECPTTLFHAVLYGTGPRDPRHAEQLRASLKAAGEELTEAQLGGGDGRVTDQELERRLAAFVTILEQLEREIYHDFFSRPQNLRILVRKIGELRGHPSAKDFLPERFQARRTRPAYQKEIAQWIDSVVREMVNAFPSKRDLGIAEKDDPAVRDYALPSEAIDELMEEMNLIRPELKKKRAEMSPQAAERFDELKAILLRKLERLTRQDAYFKALVAQDPRSIGRVRHGFRTRPFLTSAKLAASLLPVYLVSGWIMGGIRAHQAFEAAEPGVRQILSANLRSDTYYSDVRLTELLKKTGPTLSAQGFRQLIQRFGEDSSSARTIARYAVHDAWPRLSEAEVLEFAALLTDSRNLAADLAPYLMSRMSQGETAVPPKFAALFSTDEEAQTLARLNRIAESGALRGLAPSDLNVLADSFYSENARYSEAPAQVAELSPEGRVAYVRLRASTQKGRADIVSQVAAQVLAKHVKNPIDADLKSQEVYRQFTQELSADGALLDAAIHYREAIESLDGLEQVDRLSLLTTFEARLKARTQDHSTRVMIHKYLFKDGASE